MSNFMLQVKCLFQEIERFFYRFFECHELFDHALTGCDQAVMTK